MRKARSTTGRLSLDTTCSPQGRRFRGCIVARTQRFRFLETEAVESAGAPRAPRCVTRKAADSLTQVKRLAAQHRRGDHWEVMEHGSTAYDLADVAGSPLLAPPQLRVSQTSASPAQDDLAKLPHRPSLRTEPGIDATAFPSRAVPRAGTEAQTAGPPRRSRSLACCLRLGAGARGTNSPPLTLWRTKRLRFEMFRRCSAARSAAAPPKPARDGSPSSPKTQTTASHRR
jgi:hypothetical protein